MKSFNAMDSLDGLFTEYKKLAGDAALASLREEIVQEYLALPLRDMGSLTEMDACMAPFLEEKARVVKQKIADLQEIVDGRS